VGELLADRFRSRGGQRSDRGSRREPGPLVPETELAQQLVVRTPGEVSEALVQPGLEVQQLFVDDREGPAVHEQVAQVGHGAPVR